MGNLSRVRVITLSLGLLGYISRDGWDGAASFYLKIPSLSGPFNFGYGGDWKAQLQNTEQINFEALTRWRGRIL